MYYCSSFNDVCAPLHSCSTFLLLIKTSAGFFKFWKLLRRFWRNGNIFTCCKDVKCANQKWRWSPTDLFTCSVYDHGITLLDLHRWNAGTPLYGQNWLFTIQFTTFLSISLCHARMSRYRHPSSFSFRIKCPCTHWNSWFNPFQIEHTASEYLSGNQIHSEAEV